MNKKSSQRIASYNIEHITETAMRLFLSKGARNTKIDEIADEGDISKVTIYKYFPTKLDIAMAVFREYIMQQSEYVQKYILNTNYQNLSGLKQLYYLFMAYPEMHMENQGVLPFFSELNVMTAHDGLPAKKQREVQKRLKFYNGLYTSAIEKGISDGSIQQCHSNNETCFQIVQHAVQGYFIKLFLLHGRDYFACNKAEVYEYLKCMISKMLVLYKNSK